MKGEVFRVDNPFSNMFSFENISPNHINTSKHPKIQNSNKKKKSLNRAWSSFSRMLKIEKKLLSSNSPCQKKFIDIKKR
jgi:hypothetical protein